MPPKITNYLKQGLPSEIYYKAYPEPISRYKISQEIYGKGKLTSSKIIELSNILIKDGYIKEIAKNRILSDEKPLISEIKKELKEKGLTLDEKEEEELLLFAGNNLRTFMKTMDKKTPKRNINAYSEISFILNFIATTKLLMYDCKWSDFENMKIPYKNGTPEQLKLIVEIELNKELLIKLKNLSPLDISPFIELLKNSIEFYQSNEELLKNI